MEREGTTTSRSPLLCALSFELTICSPTYGNASSLYALRSLLNSLAPLIGAEAARGHKAVPPGWSQHIPEEQISEWRKQGTELVLKELEDTFQDTCAEEYRIIINKVRVSLGLSLVPQYSS